MDSLLEPVELNPETTRALDEIRAGAENALYCAKPDVSEELFAKHIVSLVEGAGLPVLQTMHYRWFLRELARLWRTRTGRDLAFHLELSIRKWVGLGLEPKTLQFLVTEAHERLKGKQPAEPQSTQSTQSPQDSTTKTPNHNPGGMTNDEVRMTNETRSPNSETRPLESLTPGILSDGTLPGCMSGPRPPSDPDTGIPDSSTPTTESPIASRESLGGAS